MKKLVTTALFACSSVLAFAQSSPLGESSCGTITTPEELQDVYDFVKTPQASRKTTATDTIPLTIHIVGKDDGTGYYKLDNLFKVLCQLNDHYKPANFYFSVKWPIKYINNTNYYIHDINNGIAMMSQNNVANTVNVYFVEDPNGNCGYYAPAGGAVAIGKSCAATNSTTLVHELGHFFGLPHTFSGWENRTTSNPPGTYERVRRSGTGSNCGSAGDGFCDTEADYLSGRWQCPYSGTYTDVNGDAFKPDGTNYMSYSNDACATNFSPQQIARMQNQLNTRYSSVLTTPTPQYTTFTTAPTIIYPVDKIFSNYTKLIWNKVPNAEVYSVRVMDVFFTMQETVTADTSLNLSFKLDPSRTYDITITPMNGVNVCATSARAAKSVSYTTDTSPLSVNSITRNSGMVLSPNPASNQVNVQLNDFAAGRYQAVMTSLNGQQMAQQAINHPGGNTTISISVAEVPAGMYFIHLTGEGQSTTQKIMVQH